MDWDPSQSMDLNINTHIFLAASWSMRNQYCKQRYWTRNSNSIIESREIITDIFVEECLF